MKKIRIILTVFFMLIFISACSYFDTYTSYDELEDVLSDYGYDNLEDYVRNHYSISDIWDNWDIEDFVRDNYYWSDIWDEDEIKEDVFELGLIEEWYEEYCSDDYDYYRN